MIIFYLPHGVIYKNLKILFKIITNSEIKRQKINMFN